MSGLIQAGDYQAVPFKPTGGDIAAQVVKVTTMLRRLAAHANLFTDYVKGCDGRCNGVCQSLEPSCERALAAVKEALADKNSMTWEVWDIAKVDLLGILRLSEVVPRQDAKAHYCFFDGRLRDKTQLLLAWRSYCFDELELRRITIEVPDDAFVLAKHANKHLGFGGPFWYRRGRAKVAVEGWLRNALLRDGEYRDKLILGALNAE